MKWNSAFAAVVVVLLSGCGARDVPATPLPGAADVPYTLSLKTYEDGHTDQPFKLLVSTPDEPARRVQILFAEQCRNVVVAQTPKLLWAFYDELALREFGSFTNGVRPRPVLCDLAASHCRQVRDEFARRGISLQQVCTFPSAYSRR
jgi:hypothetical protein